MRRGPLVQRLLLLPGQSRQQRFAKFYPVQLLRIPDAVQIGGQPDFQLAQETFFAEGRPIRRQLLDKPQPVEQRAAACGPGQYRQSFQANALQQGGQYLLPVLNRHALFFEHQRTQPLRFYCPDDLDPAVPAYCQRLCNLPSQMLTQGLFGHRSRRKNPTVRTAIRQISRHNIRLGCQRLLLL